MITNLAPLWNTIFPSIPSYVIPSDIPGFSDVTSLIDYVRKNTNIIEENWTNAIRQRGFQGRLQIMEDTISDEKYRSETLRRAIRLAQAKLIDL